jgi:5-formyltetrahydrofolate cyclo-ligase
LLAKQACFQQSQHIACYWPFDSELDTAPIIELIKQANKTCYLPVIKNTEDKALDFVSYVQGDELCENQYAIMEPLKKRHQVAPETLDLVLMPLVAFDAEGHRLGTGGGFYDTTFEFMHEQINKKPLLVGVGYAMQQAAALPADPWDVTLVGVVTEKTFMKFR